MLLAAELLYRALFPMGPARPVSVVVLHPERGEMVDLFGTPAVKVPHAVNTADVPMVIVLLVEVLLEVGTAEEVIAAMWAALVFVAQLADLDGLLTVAMDLNLEVDPVAPQIVRLQRLDVTTVAVVVIGCGRGAYCDGPSEQTQGENWNQGDLCPERTGSGCCSDGHFLLFIRMRFTIFVRVRCPIF